MMMRVPMSSTIFRTAASALPFALATNLERLSAKSLGVSAIADHPILNKPMIATGVVDRRMHGNQRRLAGHRPTIIVPTPLVVALTVDQEVQQRFAQLIRQREDQRRAPRVVRQVVRRQVQL